MSGPNKHPNDPNRGMNYKAFLIYVCIAMVAIMVGSLVLLKIGGTKDVPKPANNHPTSSLTLTRTFEAA